MKSKLKNLTCSSFLMLFLAVLMTTASYSATELELFNQANKYYMDQSYEKAAETYEKLIASKKVSAEVYYNLGNSYYKAGNIASAILNLERAQRLKPSDPDIQYNLRMANLNTIDKIEPVPQVFYERWWVNYVNEGSVSSRAILVVIFLWMALGLAAIYLFSGRVFIRKVMFFSTLLVLTVAFFTWFLVYQQKKHLNDHRAAIIFTESVYVKSSPDDKSSNLFMLHSGTRIEVLDELKGWKKIRIANGSEGWVVANSIEII
ncbi:MAG: tetratricopeptide repeat protein [Bacteroidetes bacterium]|nr:tetratricopeptide repeat protein [Bacteroidota bacterium]